VRAPSWRGRPCCGGSMPGGTRGETGPPSG
jgi:hypothetical protein